MASSDDKHLSEGGERLAAKLLTETRQELVRADTKAQILFAATGVVISVVVGGILAGNWRPRDLSCGAQAIWWVGVGTVAIGVGAMVYALWPRVGRAEASRARYFADVRKYGDRDTLLPVLNEEAGRADRDVEQLIAIAPIVRKKYIAIKVAVIALSAGAVLAVLAAVIG